MNFNLVIPVARLDNHSNCNLMSLYSKDEYRFIKALWYTRQFNVHPYDIHASSDQKMLQLLNTGNPNRKAIYATLREEL